MRTTAIFKKMPNLLFYMPLVQKCLEKGAKLKCNNTKSGRMTRTKKKWNGRKGKRFWEGEIWEERGELEGFSEVRDEK